MSLEKDKEILVYMPFEEIEKNILSHYDISILDIEFIKFKNTDKQRAVYKINTDCGPKCLKKVFYDKSELLFIYSVTEWLNLNNIGCPKFVTTKEGHKHVSYSNNLFILTDWIHGRKCDYDNYNDIVTMSDNLAKIHNSTICFKPIEGSSVKYSDSSYFYSYCTHFYQLLEFWNKSIFFKDEFSKKYIDVFDYNYMMAKESLHMINSIDFSKPLGDKISNNCICHLDYVNKNIVFNENNKIYTIDFDNTRYDYAVHDICYFLRRLLKREDTAWDFNLFEMLMESYEQNRSLGLNEYKVILAILMFPQKYWKLSKDFFKNRKYCSPASFLASMDKIYEKQAAHELFIKQLKEYINNRFLL